MIKQILAASLILTANITSGQLDTSGKANPNLQYNSAIKIYNESSIQESFKIENLQYTSSQFRRTKTTSTFFHPTFAIQLRNRKKNFHEIELNRWSINREKTIDKQYQPNGQYVVLDQVRINNTNISLKYEFIIQFCKNRNTRIVPSLGFAINPFYSKERLNPLTSIIFEQSFAEAGFRTFVVPRLSYYFSKKFFLDLNVPLCFTNISYRREIFENPALPIWQQKSGLIQFEVSPKFMSARLGLGMKL